jgi:hypothetical protein
VGQPAIEQVQICAETALIVRTVLLDKATLVFALVYLPAPLFLARERIDISAQRLFGVAEVVDILAGVRCARG